MEDIIDRDVRSRLLEINMGYFLSNLFNYIGRYFLFEKISMDWNK